MESLLGFEEVPVENEEENSSTYSRKLVPWSTWSEWLFVSQSLFSDSPDSVAAALSRVSLLISAVCLFSTMLIFRSYIWTCNYKFHYAALLWWTRSPLIHNVMYRNLLASVPSIHIFFSWIRISYFLFFPWRVVFLNSDINMEKQRMSSSCRWSYGIDYRNPTKGSLLHVCFNFHFLTILFRGNIHCIIFFPAWPIFNSSSMSYLSAFKPCYKKVWKEKQKFWD